MNNEWISARDRLPEYDVDVLVYFRATAKHHDSFGVSRLIDDGGWLNAGYSRRCDVSHWQPLPDKPEGITPDLDAQAAPSGTDDD